MTLNTPQSEAALPGPLEALGQAAVSTVVDSNGGCAGPRALLLSMLTTLVVNDWSLFGLP